MKTILGGIIILAGFGLAAVLDFSPISEIIAIASLIIGGKISKSD